MCWERLAQLHDILKLSGKSDEHFYPGKYPQLQRIEEANPELWMALNHHALGKLSFPLPREALWICLADHKASAISRRLRRLPGHRPLFRVWKDEPKSHAEYLAQPKSIALDLVALLSCPVGDLTALYKCLRPDLLDRAEATQWKGDGCPFASLETHSDLTRRWFAFFNANSDYFGVPPRIATVGEMWALRKGDLPKKDLLLLRVRVRTAGRLARLRDAVILADIPDVCHRLAEKFGSHTIYDLHDEALIIARPESGEEVERRLRSALGPQTNYFLEVAYIETPMGHGGRKKEDKPGNFLHNFPYLFGQLPRHVYPCLPAEIKPDSDNEASQEAILCDLCQMAEARVVYPREVYHEEDPVQEYLCPECKNLRKRATRLWQLVKWEEEAEKGGEENVRVCFINREC